MLKRKCSVFQGAKAVEVAKNVTVQGLINTIRGGTGAGKQVKELQEAYRASPSYKLKESALAVLAGAVVDSRRGSLTWEQRNPKPSGIMIVDIDGHQNTKPLPGGEEIMPTTDQFKNLAKLCPWAFAVWESLGGEGVKVMISIEKTTDPIAYRNLKTQVADWFLGVNLKICGSTSVRGLSFLSHDPKIWVRSEDPVTLMVQWDVVNAFKDGSKKPDEITANLQLVCKEVENFSELVRANGITLHHPDARDLSWCVQSAVGDDAQWILEKYFDDLVSHPDHFEKHLATNKAKEVADPVTWKGFDLIKERVAKDAGVPTLTFSDLPEPESKPPEDPGDPFAETPPLPPQDPANDDSKAPASAFQDVDVEDSEDPDEPSNADHELKSFSQTSKNPEPKLPILIDGLLREGGRMSIGAPSKAGKTWTLMQFGLCMAANRPWFHFRPTRKLRVLFLDFELGRSLFEERLQQVASALQISTFEDVQFFHRSLRDNTTPLTKLLKHMREWAKGFDILIVDPIYTLIARGGANENDNTEVTQVLMTIGAYTKALVYSQHFSKGNQAGKSAIDRNSGAGAFARWPDAIITLTEHEEPDHYVFESALRAFKPVDPFVIKSSHPVMTLAPELSANDLAGSSGTNQRSYIQPESVLAIIRDTKARIGADGPEVSRRAILEALEAAGARVPEAAVKRALDELKGSEQIAFKPGARGGYYIPEDTA